MPDQLHLAVSPRRGRLPPGGVARSRRRDRLTCSRPARGSTTSASPSGGCSTSCRSTTRFGLQSQSPRRARRAHRPGARSPRRRAPGVSPWRPVTDPHRAACPRPRRRTRAVPHRVGLLDARLHQQGSRRLAPARDPDAADATPTLVGIAGRPPDAGDRALQRPVRRGHRRRRGRAPAVGQLGGRRHHQGRRHRPLRRPRQAPLHRLRGPLLQRARVRRSCPGRRRASRWSPSLAHQPVPFEFAATSGDVVFVTPADDRRRGPLGRRRPRRRDRASDRTGASR